MQPRLKSALPTHQHRSARDRPKHGHSRSNGTLARAKREGWTREIQNAKALAKREDVSPAVTATEAVAITMQQRGERHLGRMANIVEKTVRHVKAMEPGAILDRIDDVETLDKVARCTFGLSDSDAHGDNFAVNIAILGT